MRSVLWVLLVGCTGANIALSMLLDRGPVQVALSVTTGVGVFVSLVVLVTMRSSRDPRERRTRGLPHHE
ncbi:hypothetical protein AB0J21_19590 [Streptomyces sp. NPDC049954]|uniref:hypothetical protein n=1 Tax=Streptomyces sp. NPDC049954 TaxID=3155779 RepID=UPI00343A82DB